MDIKDAGLKFKKALQPINPDKVRYVVVHHSDNANPDWGVIECHKWHQDGKGWSGIGYHYFIEQSGQVFFGRSNELADYIGAHVEGYNSTSVGVCLDGDYDKQTPTEANLDITARVVAMLLQRYKLPTSAIRYHIDLNPHKSCPGQKFENRVTFTDRVRKILHA